MAKKSDKPVIFEAPEGFSLPDGVNPGEPFQSMATVQQNEDGELELMELDGLPVGDVVPPDATGADDEDEDEEGGEAGGSEAGETIPTPTGAAVPMPVAKPPGARKASHSLAVRMAKKYQRMTTKKPHA